MHKPLSLIALMVTSLGLIASPAMAAEEPDLAVEVSSLPDAANPRRVVFKVTNKSEWWADETTARVATVFTGPKGFVQMIPAPTNIRENIPIENLDPGQSTTFEYILSSDCDGHELDVEVRPAKNYEGVAEANVGNNKLDNVQLCKSTQSVTSDHVIPVQQDDDEHVDFGGCACPKEPAVDMTEKTTNIPIDSWYFDYTGDFGADAPPTMRVGFIQRDDIIIPDETAIAKLGVRFDTNMLRSLQGKKVSKATITYEETSWLGWWTSGSGAPQAKAGCVARVAVATGALNSPTGFKYQTPASRDPGSREILVTQSTIDQIAGPNYGYVLLGPFDKVNADDDTSCMSVISNIVLHVTHTP